MKLKKFPYIRDTINQMKKQATEWEIMFTSYSSDRGLIYGI